MVLVIVALLVVMALAALVTGYVAFPRRGQPIAAWVTEMVNGARDKIVR